MQKKKAYQDSFDQRLFLKATNIIYLLQKHIKMLGWLAHRHPPSAILEKIPITGCGHGIPAIFLCSAFMQARIINRLIIQPIMFLILLKNHFLFHWMVLQKVISPWCLVFPGRTTEYLHSAAVEQIMKVNDPAKIAIRDKALTVIDGFMRKDEQIKIQYAAKYAGIQNAYKKWQGEVLGLTRTNAVGKKKMYEAEFQKRVNANPQWKAQYGNLLNELEAAYEN